MVGGSGLRPRLPGQSRLKTAPTIYNSAINIGSFFYDLTGRLRPAAALIWNKNQFFMYILYSIYLLSIEQLKISNMLISKAA